MTVCGMTDKRNASFILGLPGQCTVICADAECEKLPLVPRTVNVVVRPLVALEPTVIVSVELTPDELLVTDDGFNVPLVLRGNPLTLRLTVLGVFVALIVTVYLPVEPRFTVCDVGNTVIVKSAETGATVRLTDAEWLVLPLAPLMVIV